jgi:hypothetical protein
MSTNENKEIALRLLQELLASPTPKKSDAIALAQVYATLYLADQIQLSRLSSE